MRRQYIVDWKFQLKVAALGVLPLLVLGGVIIGMIFSTNRALVLTHKQQLMTQIAYLENVAYRWANEPASGGSRDSLLDSIERLKTLSQDLIRVNTQEWGKVSRLVFVLMFVFAAGVLWLGIFFSHRIAGPLYRVQRSLQTMADDIHRPIRVRATDEFQGFFKAIDEVRDQIAGLSEQRGRVIRILEEKVDELKSASCEDEEKLIEELKSQLKRLKNL